VENKTKHLEALTYLRWIQFQLWSCIWNKFDFEVRIPIVVFRN